MGPDLGANFIKAKGCQRSLRSAAGTVFLPLKGSWERDALFLGVD